MPETPDNLPPPPDERLDTGEPFDPRQWAMHGLLSAYYDSQTRDRERRAAEILAGVGIPAPLGVQPAVAPEQAGRQAPMSRGTLGSSLALRALMRHRRWAVRGAGLAAAACLVLVVTFALTWEVHPAFARAATAVARQFIDPIPIEAALRVTDPGVLRELEGGIDEATVRRDEALARFAAARAAGTANDEAQAAADLRRARENRYRGLWGVGRLPEALAEVQQAIDFGESRLAVEPGWLGLQCIALCDQGDILAAAGDYAAARLAYQASTRARLQHVGDQSTPAGMQVYVQDMTPLYWRMSYLALAEGDLQGADHWLTEAANVLRSYVIAVCRDRRADVPDDATLMAAFAAMPPEFQYPPEWPTAQDEARWAREYGRYWPNSTLVVKVHEHLYRVARLRRVQGDLDGAAEALRQLQALRAVQEYPVHDESRLPFSVPMEQARAAIARREYGQALAYVDEACKHLDELDAYDRPLGVVPRAELQMLRGTALLGLDRANQEGRQAVQRALELPRSAGARLTEQQKTAFFTWDELAKAAR